MTVRNIYHKPGNQVNKKPPFVGNLTGGASTLPLFSQNLNANDNSIGVRLNNTINGFEYQSSRLRDGDHVDYYFTPHPLYDGNEVNVTIYMFQTGSISVDTHEFQIGVDFFDADGVPPALTYTVSFTERITTADTWYVTGPLSVTPGGAFGTNSHARFSIERLDEESGEDLIHHVRISYGLSAT